LNLKCDILLSNASCTATLRSALEELSTVIAQRDEIKIALQETMARCASAMSRGERLEQSERGGAVAVEYSYPIA
jgi:hypothetical protein